MLRSKILKIKYLIFLTSLLILLLMLKLLTQVLILLLLLLKVEYLMLVIQSKKLTITQILVKLKIKLLLIMIMINTLLLKNLISQHQKSLLQDEHKQIQQEKVMIVCSCYVTYEFQSETTHYSCLNMKELLAQNRCDI